MTASYGSFSPSSTALLLLLSCWVWERLCIGSSSEWVWFVARCGFASPCPHCFHRSLVRRRRKKDVDLSINTSYVLRAEDSITRTEVSIQWLTHKLSANRTSSHGFLYSPICHIMCLVNFMMVKPHVTLFHCLTDTAWQNPLWIKLMIIFLVARYSVILLCFQRCQHRTYYSGAWQL